MRYVSMVTQTIHGTRTSVKAELLWKEVYVFLKYTCGVSLLLKQFIRKNESTVIFNTGQVWQYLRA